MRILIFAEAESVVRAAADFVAKLVTAQPQATLALPTGRTMVPFYAELVAARAEGRLDLAATRCFNLDELLLPADHPGSFSAYMERHAWGPLGLAREQRDIPDAQAEPTGECARYDAALAAAGAFDLAILGLGADGHVAYNLPGQTAEETHLVELSDAVADTLGVPAERRPLRALTMGLGPLRRARRLLLLATGADKARAVRQLVRGPATADWPCSLLREHPEFDLLLTHGAAAELD